MCVYRDKEGFRAQGGFSRIGGFINQQAWLRSSLHPVPSLRNLYFLMINGFLNLLFDYPQMEGKRSGDPFNRFGNHFLEKDFLE